MSPSGRVFTLGETVLDIILQPDGSARFCPGGSMLNSAVSLGRCGIPVEYIGTLSDDAVGQLIRSFLSDNGVATRYTNRDPGGKTTLALASLDENRDAHYTFYRQERKDQPRINCPDFEEKDLLLFGSFFALGDESREAVVRIAEEARKRGVLIVYDPNFRKPHLPELPRLLPRIRENIALADLVRASDEDCRLIFGTATPEEARLEVEAAGCNRLIYTMNRDGVQVITPRLTLSVPAIPLEPISTIGAGDAFNAGLIYSLILAGRTRNVLTETDSAFWKEAVTMGIRFASEVCRSFDNYVPASFAHDLMKA